MNYKQVIDKHIDKIDGISNYSEILVEESSPETVRYSINQLSCCICPELKDYENKKLILKRKATIHDVLSDMGSVQPIEKNTLTTNKINQLKEYYRKGLVKKELWDYYQCADSNSWGAEKTLD